MEYSTEVNAPLEFAWDYRTNIANWNDPPAQFKLDGPFVAGSHGTTLLPGQDPIQWIIRDVAPYEWFVIEIPFDGAVLAFTWRFEPLDGRKTRMTQTIALSGDNAAAYAEQVEAAFSATLADGMKRIAAEIAAAAQRVARTKSDDEHN